MNKVALITGVFGQDGSYLAELLLTKGYVVHGVARDRESGAWRHEYLGITGKVTIHTIDLTDKAALTVLLTEIRPSEIYNLAAQSSVAHSIDNPEATLLFNINSVTAILESIQAVDTTIKLFHASSSEIFDPEAEQPLTVHSPIKPGNPYGVSKAANHTAVIDYRTRFGMFAVNGILFPHESPLRDVSSFINRSIATAMDIKTGTKDHLTLGQIENKRDFGDARLFVEAMWLSLQAPSAADYIISSGTAVSIREIVEYILNQYEVPRCATLIDERMFRYPNMPLMVGDNTETKATLGWSYDRPIFVTIDDMIEFHKETDKKHEL